MTRSELINLYIRKYLGEEPHAGDLLEEMDALGIYEEVFDILSEKVLTFNQ